MSEPKLLTKEELNTRLMILGTSHPAAKEVILHIAGQENLIEQLQEKLNTALLANAEIDRLRVQANVDALAMRFIRAKVGLNPKFDDNSDLLDKLDELLETKEKFAGMMETIEGQRKALSKIEFYAESLPCKGDNCDDYNYLPCSRCSIKSLAKSALNDGRRRSE